MSILIVAEISANHNHDFELACNTIRAAAEAGADAVKIQTFKPESLALNVDNAYFGPKTEGAWKGWRSWDLYKEASLPYQWHKPLQDLTHELGMIFFSSPFDLEAIDFLESLQVPMYKIASPEITDIGLISKAAATGKPIVISTGMANEEDIQLAIDACRAVNNHDITILKCTAEYPAKLESMNLRTMVDMRERFGVNVGLSDHTTDSISATVAASLGAVLIEKHLILDRSLGGLDSGFSLEPQEFKVMVDAVRQVETALGQVTYQLSDKDKLRRRSLFTIAEIHKGDVISMQNVRSLRPGHGLHPQYLPSILGKTAEQDIPMGEALSLDMLSE